MGTLRSPHCHSWDVPPAHLMKLVLGSFLVRFHLQSFQHLAAGRNPPTPATPFENLFNTPQMQQEDILVSGPPPIRNAAAAAAANTPALLGLGFDKFVCFWDNL